MKKITAILMAALASVMLVACGSNRNTTMDNGHDTNGIAGEPTATVHPNDNTNNNAVHNGENPVNDVVDGASNATRDAANGVGNAVKDVTDGAAGAVNNAADGVKNAVDDATGNNNR